MTTLAPALAAALAAAVAGTQAPDLATPPPGVPTGRGWDVAGWGRAPTPPTLEDRERRARSHAVGGAAIVLGAGYAAYLVAIVHANATCEPAWDPFNPDCETTPGTRRAIARGAVAGLALVPPLLTARGVTRADPRVSPHRAFVRALPWQLAGAAVAAFAVERTDFASAAQLALLGVGATLSLWAAPYSAARAPPRPSTPALALPVRDPALLR